MRDWRAAAGTAGVLLPERISPSAIVHSKTAIFNSAHAARTRFTARISSTVSITMMGVEELIRTFRRSKVSAIGLTCNEILP
jgi:hypothetical protein